MIGARGVLAGAHVVVEAGAIVDVAAETVAYWLLWRPHRDGAHARALHLHHFHVFVARSAAPTLRCPSRAALLLASLLEGLCVE